MPSFLAATSAALSRLCRRTLSLVALLLLPAAPCSALARSPFAPLPAEVSSTHFTISLGGHTSPVLHAADHYYLLNFTIDRPATITIKADDPHFWDRGVEVQPMRYGIRPTRHGGTLSFPIPGPIKLSLSRPGDHFAGSEMLFLFGNPPEPSQDQLQQPGVRFIGPGVHRESIDAHSGDRIYLAPGAVVFGALNLWQVHDVRVFGTGTVIYDGPQDPHGDEGWMHKRDWHCIVMDQATQIEIDGITCITRSRTWQVQMKDSRRIGFYNVKIVGGNPSNANQDGIDWLGGGDTRVSNSFFRASDDVFALYGNWDGYQPALLKRPGHDVTNISTEDTVASTSISNIVRVGWPEKTFNSAHFYMRNMDVIHAGFGGCKVPFAFFELWADPDGHGLHHDYTLSDIRLEDWYSLFQIRQPNPGVKDVSFRDIWALDGAAMLPPVEQGDVAGVTLQDATLAGVAGARPVVLPPAEAPRVEHSPDAALGFRYTAGFLRAGETIRFNADIAAGKGSRYEWIFGDGTRAEGASVVHCFPDSQGTLLDGSGRFRVLLHIRTAEGQESWSSQSVVVGAATRELPKGSASITHPHAGERTFDGVFEVPADGGYTLTLLTSTEATLSLDGNELHHSAVAQAQVCGSPGDAVQPLRVSALLAHGRHSLRITRSSAVENAVTPTGESSPEPVVLWEGPDLPRQVLHFLR